MWDKQLGRNSASMFIFEFALSANVALYYVLFHFVAKAKERTFSEVDSLSALADMYNEFPCRTEPKGSDSLSALADTYNEFPCRTKAERLLIRYPL